MLYAWRISIVPNIAKVPVSVDSSYCFRSCQSVEHLKDLTLRLTFMLCLLSAQRGQTIKAFCIDNMEVTPSS